MTAHTPPTPPAARERKLERVCLEASTTSFFTSSAEGTAGVEDELEGIAQEGQCRDEQWRKVRVLGRNDIGWLRDGETEALEQPRSF